ncbi:MAG: S8 family serine peptidase [Anaerolineales bacterium]|jgi:thermitase
MSKTLRLFALILISSLLLMPVAAFGQEEPSNSNAPFVPGQIIVGLNPGYSIQEVARQLGADIQPIAAGRAFLLHVDGDAQAFAAEAARMIGVRHAEPNWLRELHEGPGDPDYPLKWDLNNTGDDSLCDGSDCPSLDADIDFQEAFDLLGASFSGSAVIAVIDTGIDSNHPDLSNKIVDGYDYLDGDANPTDDYGHGTHVAGIAAAATNNGIGTSGVGYSPNIRIMPLRVCDSGGCPTSAIVEAIYHAADNGADVINLSLGGSVASASEEAAINYAWDHGLVIVASSGNDGAGRVSYPAAFSNVIAVGSTNWHDDLAPYSNKGRDLDLVAPGGDMSAYQDPGGIYSTMPTYNVYLTTTYSYLTNYDQLQGTSMASPQVAGAAALLFAAGGDELRNDEVRALLESTADDLGRPGWDRSFGHGRLNLYQAVLAAQGVQPTPTPSPTPEPTPTPTPTPEPGDFTLSVNAYKVRGAQTADLAWSGASSAFVDVYRDGHFVTATENDGDYTDVTGQKGGGTVTYQVCEAGTVTCSNLVTTEF